MSDETIQASAELLNQYLNSAKEHGASDVHFAPGSVMMIRVDGKLVRGSENVIMAPEIAGMVACLLREDQMKELERHGDIDLAYTIPGFGRMRINIFKQRGTYSMAIRILSFEIPDVETLGLPDTIMDLAKKNRGLVLVTGATGSGKSTTLAALVDFINKNYSKHIITIEDPIEYLHKHAKSMVTQREMGLDSDSYASALRAALREDPDVILVGEMRDLETISTAITAAETGHLVFSTLHTNDAASAVDRVIDVFSPHQQQQIRFQLANVIEGVIAQQLLPKADGSGRVSAFEIMLANPAIRNLIREGKTFQIPTVMQTSKKDGMILMDEAILDLYQQGVIDRTTAVRFALEPVQMERKIS